MIPGGPGGQSQVAGTQGVRDGESRCIDSESNHSFPEHSGKNSGLRGVRAERERLSFSPRVQKQ